MTEINQQRIAKNTLLLYIRMIIVMLVGLYTSRVIINALGQEHYGIYEAVGSIVLMVSFISSTMSGACQRYYSYEMTKGSIEELRKVFSLSLTVFIILIAFIVLLAETAGVWFLMHKMDVSGNYQAARVVFQFSILSFSLYMLRIPYEGMVVAKEKMKVFAYLSLFEALASLGIALLLSHSDPDKNHRIILYGGLMAGLQLMTFLFYWIYCRCFYPECRFKFTMDKAKFQEIFAYAGWNMIGSCAGAFEKAGLNLLLNSMFGPLLSAARGVANKVNSTVIQLNNNFFMAVRPQIYKSYAAGEMKDMYKLVCQSTRLSFFLLMVLILPILLEIDFILPIWLMGRNVPIMANMFTRLLILEALLNCFTEPLASAVQATGNIRDYKLIIGGTFLLVLPLSYIGLKYFNLHPASVFVIAIILTVVNQVQRIWFVRKLVKLDVIYYLKNVVLPIIVVSAISVTLSVLAKNRIHSMTFSANWIGNVLVIIVSMLTVCLSFYLFGMFKTERKQAFNIIRNILKAKDKQ